jgi:hypothetical protein
MSSKHKAPLYPQLLQLKHVHPNAWQRAVLGEGMVLLGALLALADVASAWSMLVVPVLVAVVVKAHDLLAGLLAAPLASADVVIGDAEAGGRKGEDPGANVRVLTGP